MKRGCLILIIFMLGFASASVSVSNFTIKESYSPYENLQGAINLVINDESSDSVLSTSISSQSILLKNFLEKNKNQKGISYNCEPASCGNLYASSSGAEEKIISISGSDYFAFVIYGKNAEIDEISFNVSSDFGESARVPLQLKFFEKSSWKFTKASGNFGLKLNGCYNPADADTSFDISSSPYCEKIIVPETPSMKIGAEITGGDTKKIIMAVYDELKMQKASCNFFPSQADSCNVTLENSLFSGTYYICAKSDSHTNYKIKSENSGEKCGWFGLPSTENSIRDYSVFAQPALYAGAELIKINSGKIPLINDANLFLQNNYNKNCTSGCVLPVFAEGVAQNLKISDLNLIYSNSEGSSTANLIYNSNQIPAKIDFSGELKLDLLGFNAGAKGNKTFDLLLNGNKLASKKIIVFSAPVIQAIYPQNTPAGIATIFISVVESENNISSYSWDFGDGDKETTAISSVSHSYKEIKAYTITLEVTDIKGMKSIKKFAIIAGSPKEVLNATLKEKKDDLNNTLFDTGKFPAWQANAIRNNLNISFYQKELDNLEKERQMAILDSEFLDIAIRLQELDIPKNVRITASFTLPPAFNLDDINPGLASFIDKTNVRGKADEYGNAIFQWELKNIGGTISKKTVSVTRESGKEFLMDIYRADLNLKSSEEGYFFINGVDLLGFKESGNLIFSNISTAIVLSKGNNILEFYALYPDAVFFASPKLGLFLIDAEIGLCNYNGLCEGELGENSGNCRNDCKPVGKAILYIFLSLLFLLAVYTAFQIWYKFKYETFLFKDRKYLYNLIMFINNARAKELSEYNIKELLKKQNWNSEQIVYAIKKSRGERTGLYEIIPVDKIIAYFRRKKAEKNIANENLQLNRQNINKPAV